VDGISVIRTSESRQSLTAEDTVRTDKSLSQVERLFRTLKGIDLRGRPIRPRTEEHVRAHVFLCLLAYYLEWHLRQALAPLLFDDEELTEERKLRDPVAPAQPSAAAKSKKAKRITDGGLTVQSYETMLADLATRCRNRCRVGDDPAAAAFDQVTRAAPLQARALELLDLYPGGSD
jgi:hypothetical protein